MVSKVLADSSPQPLARAVKTQEPEGQLVHANLKLIEEVDIFKEDIKEKPSTVSVHILKSKQLSSDYRVLEKELSFFLSENDFR